MNAAASPFVIAHATDLHPEGGVAFRHGLALARDMHASLVTLHTPVDGQPTRLMPKSEPVLRAWHGDEAPKVAHETKVHHCCDDAVDSLLDALKTVQPDLLVVGTSKPRGIERFLRGSVSETLASQTDVPTLFLPYEIEGFVSPDDGLVALKNILIPAADEDSALRAAGFICDLVERAGLKDIKVTVLHVGDDDIAEGILMPETHGVSWKVQQTSGNIVDAITGWADKTHCDLIVMATHGHDSVLDMLRGSTTERVLRRSECPMLSVPLV